jgi:hypothetical protein
MKTKRIEREGQIKWKKLKGKEKEKKTLKE